MTLSCIVALLVLSLAPPGDIAARDVPNDAGGKIAVTWTRSPDTAVVSYRVLRQTEGDTEWDTIGMAGRLASRYFDEGATDGTQYRYKVLAEADTLRAESEPSAYAKSAPQWFNTGRIPTMIGTAIIFLIFMYTFQQPRRAAKMFIRRIAGLDAVEEALGRATEMGRPTLYVPGLSTIEDVATIASLNILGGVAKKTAKFGTPLIVPNRDPIVYTVAREVVKESYASVGRPDAFSPDSVFFLTDQQLPPQPGIAGLARAHR